MRCTDRRLIPRCLGQHPAGPVGGLAWRRPERQIDHPLHGGRRAVAACRACASCRASAPRRPPPSTGPASATPPASIRPSRALSRECRNRQPWPEVLARHPCFCRALPSATIASSRRRSTDVTFTILLSALMQESLNCFGQFGNRPNGIRRLSTSRKVGTGFRKGPSYEMRLFLSLIQALRDFKSWVGEP